MAKPTVSSVVHRLSCSPILISTVQQITSLIPRLSQNANIYCGESLVSFLRKHDIGPKQKGSILRVVQLTVLQCSVCVVFDARQLDTCGKLPATFTLFPVLSRRYAHAQLSPLYLLSTFGAFHVTKNTRLSTPAQLQCLRSRAWKPGNEASRLQGG